MHVAAAELQEQKVQQSLRGQELMRERLQRRGTVPLLEDRLRSRKSSDIAALDEEGGEDHATGILSVYPNGTYYIYGYDGKLLAEYDGLGNCVRDYIYVGSRLFAEYRVQENRLYYYLPDQINSTRMITDETGTAVYSAAHDPYGGIQKTWVSTYDPALKFSGKERDTESDLDYFGARYYDHSLYRFLSVDPVTTHLGYLSQTHAWNLYVYCGNNPLINIDQSGKWYTRVHYNVTYAAMIMAFKDWDPTFAHNLAHAVASACAGVDTDPSTTSAPYWESSPADLPGGHWVIPNREQRTMWHFPDGNRYAAALDTALSTLDPIEFGKALHVNQDYFSHNRYDSDHLFDSIFAQLGMSLDPDNPFHYWDAALAMAYLTLDLCYAYEQRLKAAYAN